MTFFVGSAFEKVFRVKKFTKSDLGDARASWLFEFENDQKEHINTTDIEQDGADILITIIVPTTHFTLARKGDCVHQVIVYDNDNQPIYYSDIFKDHVYEPLFQVSDL